MVGMVRPWTERRKPETVRTLHSDRSTPEVRSNPVDLWVLKGLTSPSVPVLHSTLVHDPTRSRAPSPDHHSKEVRSNEWCGSFRPTDFVDLVPWGLSVKEMEPLGSRR